MEQQKSVWFLVWGVFSVLFFFACLTTGIGGVVLTYYSQVSYLVPYYAQCGTAVLGFALTVCETGLLICALRWRERPRDKASQQSANNIALQPVLRSASHSEDLMAERVAGRSAQRLSIYQCVQLFFSLLGCNVSLLLVFLSLTVVYNYQNTAWIEGKLWPFIVVDIILGIFVPSVTIGSALIIMSIIREAGSIETRKLLPSIFGLLRYEQGERESRWVIVDSFYYKIASKGICYSSWSIYSMFIATFLTAWCFFINKVVTTRYGIPGCSHLTDQTKAVSYCFLLNLGGYSNVYINCTLNATYNNQLFCFEFKRIGRDASSITYAIISIVLYFILVTVISAIFRAAKELALFATKKCWSSLIVITGIFIFAVSVTLYGTSIYVYNNLNILTGIQIIAICMDIMLVGIVILRSDSVRAMQRDEPVMRRRNSTLTTVSGAPSLTNSEIPSQHSGYSNPLFLQHRGSYNVAHHQRSHSLGYVHEPATRRGRNPRHHAHRPLTRPQLAISQQVIAERHHVFDNLNRPTEEAPTPSLPQASVRNSPASSLCNPPSLTISRASTPHSSANGASAAIQPSPMLSHQQASLRTVSEKSLDEGTQQQQLSDQHQTSLHDHQPVQETQHLQQEKQEIQLQLRVTRTDTGTRPSEEEVSEMQDTTPGAPLPPNGALTHSDGPEAAAPIQQVPIRQRASSNIGSEEGRYSILFPRSPTPSSADSNTSTLERGYRRNSTTL